VLIDALRSNRSLVLYHTRILDVGTLEYWGIPQPQGAASFASVANAFDWDAGWGDSEVETYAPAPIQARCGSNQHHCADISGPGVSQQVPEAARGDFMEWLWSTLSLFRGGGGLSRSYVYMVLAVVDVIIPRLSSRASGLQLGKKH
jgi:hypothetical protein